MKCTHNTYVPNICEELTVLEYINKDKDKYKYLYDLLNNKVDQGGNFIGSWHGIPHPVFSEPGIQGQVIKNIEDINNLNLDMGTLNSVKNGNSIFETDYLYEPDKVSLTDTGYSSFYGETAYPSVSMTLNGQLKFTGNTKLTGSLTPFTDGTIKIGKIFHIPFADKEGIPLRGHITCCKANGGMKLFPVIIQSDGTICVGNDGTNEEYSARIDWSSLTVNTMNFGNNKVVTNIQDKCIQAMGRRTTSPFQSVFFTDLHYNIFRSTTFKRTLEAINHVDNILDLSCVISGGDNIVEPFNMYSTATKHQNVECVKSVVSAFKKNKFIYTNGNHDNCSLHNYPNNKELVVRPHHIKPFTNNKNFVYGAEDKWYGYLDDYSSQTRVIVFDTNESDFSGDTIGAGANCSVEQLEWLGKNAFTMGDKKGWKILCICHVPPVDDEDIASHLIPQRASIRALLKACKLGNDISFGRDIIPLSQQGPQLVIGMLSGHNHKDTISYVDNIAYVTSLLAWSTSVTANPRAIGHVWELCFDIVSIDESQRKVFLDRVGRGADRNFTY